MMKSVRKQFKRSSQMALVYNDDSEDELELCCQMKGIRKCSIMKNGVKPYEGNFYFCSCDPDQKDPICIECKNICHKGHIVQDKPFQLVHMCQCGLKNHKITSDMKNENSYDRTCYFHELSIYSNVHVYYKIFLPNYHKNICMFCNFFCIPHYTEQERKYTEKMKVNNKDEIPCCECNYEVHNDVQEIYACINYLKIYNLKSTLEKNRNNLLGYFSSTSFLNTFFMTDRLKKNIYSSFIYFINKLKSEIKNPEFEFDPRMNYSSFYWSLQNIVAISKKISGKHAFYFSETIRDFFMLEFIYDILDKKFTQHNKSTWDIKSAILQCYRKITFNSDIGSIPNFKFEDMANLSPIIRLILMSNVKKCENNFIRENFENLESSTNIIDKFLSTLKSLNKSSQLETRSNMIFNILHILKKLSKHYLFSNEQILNYCKIVDFIINELDKLRQIRILREKTTIHTKKAKINSTMINAKDEAKKSEEKRVLKHIVKTLLFFCFYYNDKHINSYINSNDSSNYKFLHGKNEIGKIISKICVKIINNLNHSDKSYKKLILYSNNLLGLCMSNEDFYTAGLKRDLEHNLNYYLKIANDQLTPKENKFILTMKDLSKDLEILINDFYNLKCDHKELCVGYKNIIHIFFNSIASNGNEINFSTNMNLSSKNNLISNNNNFNSNFNPNINNFINTVNINNASSLDRAQQSFLIPDRSNGELNMENPINNLNRKKSAIYNNYISEEKNKNDYNFNFKFNGSSQNDGSSCSSSQEETFRILMIKSNFIFSLVKFLLLESSSKCESTIEDTELESSTIDLILKVLQFFVKENVPNSIILMTSDVLRALKNVPLAYSGRVLDLLHGVLFKIAKSKTEIPMSKMYYGTVKHLALRSINSPEQNRCIRRSLKIIDILLNNITSMNFNHKILIEKVKKFIVKIYKECKVIKSFKKSLSGSSEADTIKTRSSRRERYDNLNSNENTNLSIIYNVVITEEKLESNNSQRDQRENNINDIDKVLLSSPTTMKIFKKFLKIINDIFEENSSILSDIHFIKTIFTLPDLQNILTKTNLNLGLRTEILRYFRLIYLDVNFSFLDLERYKSEFMQSTESENSLDFKSHGMKILLFYRNLFKISQDSRIKDDCITNVDPLSKFLSVEYEILLFECENFEKIIGNSLWNHDRDKDKDYYIYYLENAVLIPLKIFFNKIFSLLLHLNGREFLKIYNLIYNSMLMKKYVLENRYIFKPEPKKDLFNKFYKKEKEKIKNPKNENLNRRKYEIADPEIFVEYELEIVKKVIHQMTDISYRAFDYNLIYETVKKHFFSMFKPINSKSLSSLFDKQDSLPKEEQDKLYKEMTEKNLLKNNHEKKYFNILIKYQDSKKSLLNCCLIENLSDLNTVYDVNYRHLILKSLLKSLSSTSVNFVYYKEYYSLVFKFLQFDTAKSQFEIKRLNEENKNIINFDILINNFFASLLDVIFSSYHPSNKQDYFIALNIIKILKYLCEEHNNYFQSIMLKKLNFFYNNKSASFFDFLMMVINRIILISGWEGFSEYEIYSDYFYDIFSCLIELVIEMIQGTNSENFSLILNDNYNEKKKLLMNFKQEEKDKINSLERERKSSKLLLYSQMIQEENKEKAFILFINSIKPIILNENSASKILFKVKTDLANLLLAFLEDRECPRHIKLVIVKNFPTQSTLNTICKSLKLFYIRIKEERKNEFICGTRLKNQDSQMESNETNNIKINKQIHLKSMDKYKLKLSKTIFDNKVYDMLVDQYFKDEEFSECAEFKFTSTLFSFVKLIAIENYNYEAYKILEKAKYTSENLLLQSLNIIRQKKFKPKSQDISKDEKDFLTMSNSQLTGCSNPFAYLKSENQEYLIENYYIIKFFEKVTRTIQVQIGDYTTPVIFSLPPKVIYLSMHTKKNFIKYVNRENRLTKLIDLLNYSEYFKDEVVYNFVKGKSNFLFRFSNSISYYLISYFTFIFVFCVNIYMILYYQTELGEFQELDLSAPSHRLLSVSASEIVTTNLTWTNSTSSAGWILSNFNRRNDEGITYPLFCLSLFHLFFNIIFMLLWSITKLPLYFSNSFKRTKDLMKVDDKQISKAFKLSLIIQEIFNREESIIFVWNIIFSIIFMFIPSFEFLFSLQLLLVIHLSSTLKNIVLSFKLRSMQFLNTFVLLLIFNYLYSVLAFFFIRDEFYDQFYNTNDCESLLMCFIYIFSNGLKRHGGIGDVIKLSSFLWDEGHFYGLFLYKMLYFIICVVLLLNIIFGIIINTFTELRLKDSEKHYDKVNRCFICGEEKDDLEKIGEKFDQHTGEAHNFWNYVYYIIKLKFSDIQDLNAINASVMQKILENDISWIPSRKIIPSREELISNESYLKSKSNRELTVVLPAKKKSSFKEVQTLLSGTLTPVVEE